MAPEGGGGGAPSDAVPQQLGDQVDGADERVEEGVEPPAVRYHEVPLHPGAVASSSSYFKV